MLGNEPVVVINSAKAAQDIFLSHGSALSSRPSFYTFHKVTETRRVAQNLGRLFVSGPHYWDISGLS